MQNFVFCHYPCGPYDMDEKNKLTWTMSHIFLNKLNRTGTISESRDRETESKLFETKK